MMMQAGIGVLPVLVVLLALSGFALSGQTRMMAGMLLMLAVLGGLFVFGVRSSVEAPQAVPAPVHAVPVAPVPR